MPVRRVFTVLLLALAGCGSSQSPSQAKPPSAAECGPAAAKTLTRNAAARVYRQDATMYGCSTTGGHSHRLGSTGFCTMSDRIGPIALTGVAAAYGIERCGVDTGTAKVAVRRLTDGTVLHLESATSRVPGAESYQSVGSIVVRADGAVAWIGEARSIVGHGPVVIEVHRIDLRGPEELDRGPGIAAGSLYLRGSRLTWAHGGRLRTATLS